MSEFRADVLADSISPDHGWGPFRLVSLHLVYPRMVHQDFLTHRMFSRNASSSRAVPVSKTIQSLRQAPYVPDSFALNQKGMVAGLGLDPGENCRAQALWHEALDLCLERAQGLSSLRVHKQWVNRLLEPYSWIHVIVTATEWDGFLAQRDHPDAQPEMQTLARLIRQALESSTPKPLYPGDWHLPFVTPEEREKYNDWACQRLSLARCARVSYVNHQGQKDLADDLRLANDLMTHLPPHSSPLEHQATPLGPWEGDVKHKVNPLTRELETVPGRWADNFRGFKSFRFTEGL